MELKKFKLFDYALGGFAFLVSAIVYLLTIEPTTSFWDCGEFIASSYKLEIGHPPGNPVFQLIARFFTMFGGPEQAAMLVNAMSALCSALTIMFLFWTITHLGRRILEKSGRELALDSAIAILGSGLVGALIYTFSDTFWFSAVEAEVYAMSSLFTAAVLWAMLKWEETADEPHSNRWIILIAFLMGLSIGVHLLNLLAIPALVFIYYYKKYDVSNKRSFFVLCLSAVILALILWGIIPYLPKLAGLFDLLFVNLFGLSFNSGAAFFVIALLAACLWLIWYSYKKNKVLMNTIMLCFTMIVIGYSTFAVVIIRSSANTPTNENQPDNPFSLGRYLARDQYGSKPLIYGETYASGWDMQRSTYWAKMGDRYEKFVTKKPVYNSDEKMLFPRMWYNDSGNKPAEFYGLYTQGRGKSIPGNEYKIPLMRDNLAYFMDFQLNWMYFRYFMWNFAGRQNDFHADAQDNIKGNWKTGIGFLDKMRLGDQSEAPAYLSKNKAKNHYYMIPLLLGLIGLFYQLNRDKRNWWVTMMLFLLTGIAVVVYLNQPPFQVRERDYAYAGSFYVFSIWTGLAVMAINDLLRKWLPERYSAAGASVLALLVPIQMGCQNWDDHDRSGRYTARDLAYNYLAPAGENSILVTIGDNDTFPLWYIQEVEGVRKDVRIVNTSLLGTDWYIEQMKYKIHEADPLPMSLERRDYMLGTNDFVYIDEHIKRPVLLKEVIEFVKGTTVLATDPITNAKLGVLPVRKFLIPVNKDNALKSGIISEKEIYEVPDTIMLEIPESQRAISKADFAVLDVLANYEWDRILYFNARGGDLKIGIESYLRYDGFTYRFVPIRNEGGYSKYDADRMYDNLMNVYRWGNMNDPKVNIDYQNIYTFMGVMPLRSMFSRTAGILMQEGDTTRAVALLDKMQEIVIPSQFPLNFTLFGGAHDYYLLNVIDMYLMAGEIEKALALADAYMEEIVVSTKFFATPFRGGFMSEENLLLGMDFISEMYRLFKSAGMEDKAAEVQKRHEDIYYSIVGEEERPMEE